jgi:GNAT superfamily N-acetyltransferase
MNITLEPVQTARQLRQFITFPWRVNRNDPNWVPPLIKDRLGLLDVQHNPFWREAERALWIAYCDRQPIGTIAAIIDHHRNRLLGESVGWFGFFECIQDQEAADRLLGAAADWLQVRGMTCIRGPYNPTPSDEIGILVKGFETRPALLEAHNPPYYSALLEASAFTKHKDFYAYLGVRPPGMTDYTQVLPEKMRRLLEHIRQRRGLTLRCLNMADWENEIRRAGQIYNAAFSDQPGFVPLPEAEFLGFSNAFKPIIDPQLAIVAEAGNQAVAFALALPDLNQALQHVNGRLSLPGLLNLWWHSRHLRRIAFKILVVIPEYRNSEAAVLLAAEIIRVGWQKGYQEADFSLMGDENWRILRFMENLGQRVYRCYRVYQRDL